MIITKELNGAIFTSLLGKYSLYIFQIISLGILSRLFSPEMFGVIAALQIFIIFFQLVVNSSLSPAIIYKSDISTSERNGIFSATLLIGIVASAVFILCTPLISSWLDLGDVGLISIILGCNVFFSALSMLPMALIQKDAKFLLLSTAEVLAELISLIISILLYSLGFGLEALASKLICVPIFRFVFYYVSSSKTSIGRPKFGKKPGSIFSLFDFAKFQIAFNIVNFFSRNLDTLLITKYFGLQVVGFYDKSYQVMRYPLQLFTFAINPALQPILTKYKDQPRYVSSAYYSVILKLSVIGIFVSFLLFYGASEVIFIMFGSQWTQASTYLAIFSVSVPLQMVLSSTGGIFQSFGKAKSQFYCGLFSSLINVTMIIIGVLLEDLVILCKLVVFGYVINYFQCFFILHTHVLKEKFNIKTFFISIIVLIPYFNLINFDREHFLNVHSDYLAVLLHLATLSIIGLFSIAISYVLLTFFKKQNAKIYYNFIHRFFNIFTNIRKL